MNVPQSAHQVHATANDLLRATTPYDAITGTVKATGSVFVALVVDNPGPGFFTESYNIDWSQN